MLKSLPIVLAAFAIGTAAAPEPASGQAPSPGEANAGEESAQSLEEARRELEKARADLEAAARKVAELSRGPFGYQWAFSGQRSMLGLNIAAAPDSSGVRVLAVSPGGPAAAAGVETGDIITSIDGVALTGEEPATRLIEHLEDVEPGQDVALRILRGGDARDITVATRESDANVWVFGPGVRNPIVVAPTPPAVPNPGSFKGWIGPFQGFFGAPWSTLELVTLTPELGSYFGATEGLLVVRAPDDAIGLQDGDVILEIGGRAPTSPEHAMRILMSFAPGETLTFAIMRTQRRQTVEYVIPESQSEG